MTARLIANGLTVTCSDGTIWSDVVMLLQDGKRVYQTLDGQKLCAKHVQGGVFGVSPMLLAAICCACPAEEP